MPFCSASATWYRRRWSTRTAGWSDLFGGGLATAAVAETADAAFELEAGDVCWIFVVGYDGLVSDYELWLE